MGGRTIVSDEEEEIEEEEGSAAVGKGDDDVEEGEEGENNRDDDEDEEEGADEYEQDDFIVDDLDEEEEEQEEKETDGERHKKKKKKRRESERNFELDEDDYALLEDNNITVNRPKPGKFKRLKKAGRPSGSEERSGFYDDEDEPNASQPGGRTAEEKLKHSLFGDDEGAPLEDIGEEEEQQEEEDVDLGFGEEDEMADFIVDEDDEEVDEETGEVLRRRKEKPRKPRQAAGVSSSALMEAQEIFGDVDELLLKRRQELERDDLANYAPKRLEDEFEPFILSEKYMTPKDDLIRDTDVPERIQAVEELTGPPPTDDQSILEESAWIHNQLMNDTLIELYGGEHIVRNIQKEDIGNVLTMMRVQRLDIPFIAMYRKELCGSLLKDPEADTDDSSDKPRKMKWHKLLWAVFNLDKKYLLIRKRKSSLEIYYQKRFEEEFRRVEDERRIALNRQIFNSISDALSEAKSEREVDDVDAKFNLHFPPGEADADEGQFKRPKRKSMYSVCHKAGLWEVATKFGFSSEQFGLLLTLAKVTAEMGELEDSRETPEEIAANFTCKMFETAQDVLKGARHMAAVEIGWEPIVRKHVRSIFMEKGVVCTNPTQEGNQVIDQHHELAGVKWLQDKPISKFVDHQWLLIQKGEEEKLLQVKIKLPEDARKNLMSEAREFYLSDRVSKSAQLWNEQRELILEDSFTNILLPSLQKEARSILTSRAKSFLLMEYGKQLWTKVSVSPIKMKKKDAVEESDEEQDLRVMAVCWGPGRPATTFVMLDSAGEMADVLYAGSISIRSQGVAEQQRKRNDQQRVLKFITDHNPHAVCIGAANLACKALKDDIYEVIFKIVEDHPRDLSQDIDHISIIFCDESLARLYENSRVASDQIPSQQGIVKRAVALGRYLQNPLAMVATLCGPNREILSWKLCPHESFLTPDEKFEMVEQIMVDATNQVGLDVNLASSHEWLFAPLQFIAGLGPRKASALQKALLRAGSIVNRKEIPMGKFQRKKGFYNCVGFLRVRLNGVTLTNDHIMDLLDDTRIHPESYELAKTLAKDVYSEDMAQDANEMDDDEQEMVIEHVRQKPRMLKALDIDEYIKSIPDGQSKRDTLYDIKMEILHGFQDWRVPFRDPTPDEEFLMLCGESDESLAEGRIVQVTVRAIQESRIMCAFDSGLKAYVSFDDFADGGYDPQSSQVREGDILTGKIRNVNRGRFAVFLSCKESDMRRRVYADRSKVDPYYHEMDMSSKNEVDKEKKKKELAKKHFKPRMIVHPRFRNLTADEAMEYLADKDPGESIVRPSSKGPSFLTLTLKIYDGVYAHKEIIESGKDHKDITSLLRLGKTLTIGDDTFEDLDEVMDRYVDPLVGYLKQMLSYRKFKKGTKKEIDDQLRADKAKNPSFVAYCLGVSQEHPGTFILTYIRSENPHHEYIGLFPKGFRFRSKDFADDSSGSAIDRLLKYFQKTINNPPPATGMPLRNVAAMVPRKFDGDGGGGGWRGGSDRGGRGGRYDSRDGGGRDGFRGRGRGRGRGGRGRGRDDYNNNNDDGGGLDNFPGAKVLDSPGRGGWGEKDGGGGAWGGGWGGGGGSGGGGGGDGGGW